MVIWRLNKRKMKRDRLNKKSLDEMIDPHIGQEGTEKRDAFEEELRLDILGQTTTLDPQASSTTKPNYTSLLEMLDFRYSS